MTSGNFQKRWTLKRFFAIVITVVMALLLIVWHQKARARHAVLTHSTVGEPKVSYTVLTLSTPRGMRFDPSFLNNRGQIAGTALPLGVSDEASERLAILSDGHWNLLKKRGMFRPVGFNNNGQVAYANYLNRNMLFNSFLWSVSGLTLIPMISHAINDRGQVVGSSLSTDHRHWIGCLWENDKTSFPGGHQSNISAEDINNRSEIVGSAPSSMPGGNGPMTILLYRAGRWEPLFHVGSETLGTASRLYQHPVLRLTDTDKILIVNLTIGHHSSLFSAAVWSDGRLTPIRASVSIRAKSINDSGDVIGIANLFSGKPTWPFVWRDGKLYDLNAVVQDHGVHITDVYSINKSGRILCKGTVGGHDANFVLIPAERVGLHD